MQTQVMTSEQYMTAGNADVPGTAFHGEETGVDMMEEYFPIVWIGEYYIKNIRQNTVVD